MVSHSNVLMLFLLPNFFVPGGLDDTLGSILNLCQENQVPVVFALKRQLLGKVLLKKVPVSIVGIFNYDGAQVSHVNSQETQARHFLSND